MLEESLVFVKPGNEGKAEYILTYLDKRLQENFEKLIPVIVSPVPKQLIEEHYVNLKGLPYFDPTISAFVGKDITLTVYKGERIIKRVREIIGDTDPKKAESGTIRKVFGKDSLEDAIRENRYLDNVIHASSDKNEAEREIRIWNSYLEKCGEKDSNLRRH